MSKRQTDPAIRRELRALRAAHPELASDSDGQRQMERLAALRVRFRQLDAAISSAGGAHAETATLVAESRQVSRACLALETQLNRPFVLSKRADEDFSALQASRRQFLARASAAPATEPQPESRPITAAALLRRDRDEFDS